MNKKVDDINQIVKDFFLKFSLTVEQKVTEQGGVYRVELKTPDAALIIGRGGETLAALQYILALIVQNSAGFDFSERIIVDINDYRKSQDEQIVSMAKTIAEKVVRENKSEILQPMTSYERRLVHTALADSGEVLTESIGEGSDRRLMIRLKSETA